MGLRNARTNSGNIEAIGPLRDGVIADFSSRGDD